MQTQPGGSQCDHAPAFPQHSQNMFAFDVFEGTAAGGFDDAWLISS